MNPNTVFTRLYSILIQSQFYTIWSRFCQQQRSQKKKKRYFSITSVVTISSINFKCTAPVDKNHHYLRFLHKFFPQLRGSRCILYFWIIQGWNWTLCHSVGYRPIRRIWRLAGTPGRAGLASLSCAWEQEKERWNGRSSILGFSCTSWCILIPKCHIQRILIILLQHFSETLR